MLKGISMNPLQHLQDEDEKNAAQDEGTGQGSDPAVVEAQDAAEEEQDHEDGVEQRFHEADPRLLYGIGRNAFEQRRIDGTLEFRRNDMRRGS